MLKKKIASQLFALSVLSVSSGQIVATDGAPDVISVISSQEYVTFDPYLGYDWLTYISLTGVCANLTAMKQGLHVAYDLATDIEYQNNNSSIIFKLDDSRKFHNGQSITARDVVYSFNRLLSPTLQSPGAGMFHMVKGFDDYTNGITDSISGIKAISDHSVRIDLSWPSNSFFYALTTNFGCILPYGHNPHNLEIPISGGPLKIDRYDQEAGSLYLSSFVTEPSVYKKEYEEIIIRSNLMAKEVLALYANGEVDVVLDGLEWYAISSENSFIKKEGSNDKKARKTKLSPALTYMALNTRLPPFDNVKVRQAVNYAVDRDKLTQILQNAATSTSQIIPPLFAEHDENISQNIYDPKKARELLEGLELPIRAELYAVDEKVYRELVYSIVEDLRQIGIIIMPKYGNHDQIVEVGVNPEQGQIIFSEGLGWFPDYLDVSNFYFPLLSATAIEGSGWNWSAFDNPDVEKLANKADRLVGDSNIGQRRKLWQQVFQTIQTEAPMIPLYNRLDWIFIASRIDGEDPLSSNMLSFKTLKPKLQSEYHED
jgi:ABC-type transport system substrate-binding protein